MEARVTHFDVLDMAAAVDAFRPAMDPIEALPGNRGAMVLTNWDGGKALGLSFWESAEGSGQAKSDRWNSETWLSAWAPARFATSSTTMLPSQ